MDTAQGNGASTAGRRRQDVPSPTPWSDTSTRSFPPCGSPFLHHLHTAPKSKHVNLPTSAPMSKVPSAASIGAHHVPSSASSMAHVSPSMSPFEHTAHHLQSQLPEFPPSPTSQSPQIPFSEHVVVQAIPRRPSTAPTRSADDVGALQNAEVPHASIPPSQWGGVGVGERTSLGGVGGRLSAPSLGAGVPLSAPQPIINEANVETNGDSPLSWHEFSKQYSRGQFDPVQTPNAPNADVESPLCGPRQVSPPVMTPQMSESTKNEAQSNSEPQTRCGSTVQIQKGPSSAPTMNVPQSVSISDFPVPRQRSLDFNNSARVLNLQLPPRSDGDNVNGSDSTPERATIATPTSPISWTSTYHSDAGPSSHSSGLLSRGHSLHGPELLPTIQASPAETPGEVNYNMSKPPPSAVRGGGVLGKIPAATAPIQMSHEPVSPQLEDYFGAAGEHRSTLPATATPDEQDQSETPDMEWPNLTSYSQCEGFFRNFGFLAAPHSPWEAQRLKALYNYNILHTAADINFDRIAHMIKLVFKAKMTFISLLDGETCWFKAKSGFAHNLLPRTTSMCSHTILLDSDEPLVILDTTTDWRFAQNPHVVGEPNVRFYAGAPLRTPNGHNLGSLCIVDDSPRSEFSPRSRHILKEFAAIVMRELELWRDRLQLRTRDKIQTSMEKFTRECLEIDDQLATTGFDSESRMNFVYSRAAKLVRNTLELDGCAILDISQFERTEVTSEDGEESVIYHATPYAEDGSRLFERAQVFGPVNAFPVLSTAPETDLETRQLTPVEHEKMSLFLSGHRDGKIFENVAPSWIRYIFPSSLKYGMVVPVFGIDKQPFALICAYTHDKGKQFLEGYELQFLRAIGVILLSAALRQRMMVADRSKSVLISSVSHELRTPLHGILAASELLGDSTLDTNQEALLGTVRTCGLQLIETVNHVLDFTKLSGASKQLSATIQQTPANLAELILQTVESCWLGQRGRLMQTGDSDVGSFYAPVLRGLLPQEQRLQMQQSLAHVETVLDIGIREKGWNVICESGGLRRILMNLYGNSIKFTTHGYVQIVLRELPHASNSKRVPVQMAVIDTGRGISKSFLKDQLFQPFSQENPMQPGTGLGLAIVNSIAHSEAMNGSVEVWSIEGEGTEIRVTFDVEILDSEEDEYDRSAGLGFSVAFINFDPEHRGLALMVEVMSGYARYLGFDVVDDPTQADVFIINEVLGITPDLINVLRGKPMILIVTFKIYTRDMLHALGLEDTYASVYCKPMVRYTLLQELERASNFLRHGKSPAGELQAELADLSIGDKLETTAEVEPEDLERPEPVRETSNSSDMSMADMVSDGKLSRRSSRRSSGDDVASDIGSRPHLAPRGSTFHGTLTPLEEAYPTSPGSLSSSSTTISLADGGALLRTATIPEGEAGVGRRRARVMVVEDNAINRRVLGAFLRKKGFEYAEAVDGSAGVQLFDETMENSWDVVLMDITMPVMNGYDATRRIRALESARRAGGTQQKHTKIFALTGLATQDDKRKAFGSGVDGYLVKPVSLASLDLLFKKIGF